MESPDPQGDPVTQSVLQKPPTGSWRASWGRHETNLLLEAIFKTGKVHQIISGTSQRKSKFWREITEALAQRHAGGYTAEQCRTKWKHLKSQFRFEQARYLTTGAHSDPLPHFYEKMSTLWKMAAGGAPNSGHQKRPKRPTRTKVASELQKQNKREEMPAQLSVQHPYDPGPDKPEELPGTWSQPPQAVTTIRDPQSKDSETNNALQQEKPEVPSDPRYQEIGEAMAQVLEELRNLSRTQQEMSVVNMYIAKVLQYQQEQLIPGIRLLNHNMYQLCLLLANQAEATLHPGPVLPQMINPSILLGSPVPQPYSSTFEPPGGPHPRKNQERGSQKKRQL